MGGDVIYEFIEESQIYYYFKNNQFIGFDDKDWILQLIYACDREYIKEANKPKPKKPSK